MRAISALNVTYLSLLIMPSLLIVSILLTKIGMSGILIISGHIGICALVEALMRAAKIPSLAIKHKVVRLIYAQTVLAVFICVIALSFGYFNRDMDTRGVVFSIISAAWIFSATSRMHMRG